ncbi:uncharacterized protein LOC143226931, partial [Tachypleus tridentatus]|uniref:uncharacterized protein LOC143226931 n=1 Tax=Tachypleus tridentatus TaxID=6853 RepID=UPI003FD1787F
MDVTNTCFDMSGSGKDSCLSVYHDHEFDTDKKEGEEYNPFNGNSEVLFNMLHPTTPSSAASYLELVEDYFPEISTSTELFPELSDLTRVQENDTSVVNLSEHETLVASDIESSGTVFTFSNIHCITADKSNESNILDVNKLTTNKINNDNEVNTTASSTLGVIASPSQGKYLKAKMNNTIKCSLNGTETENKNRSNPISPYNLSCVREEAGKEMTKISEWCNTMNCSVSGVTKPVIIKVATNFKPGVQLIGNDNTKKCVRSTIAEVLPECCYCPKEVKTSLNGEDLVSSKISSSCLFNFNDKSDNRVFKVGENLPHKIKLVQKCSLEPNYILKMQESRCTSKFTNSVDSVTGDTSKSDDSDNSNYNFENCNLSGQSELKVSDLNDLPCLSKNAIAARENRKKKKKYVEQLENSVKKLTKDNEILNQSVKEMREVIVNLTNEVSYLRGVVANIEEISTLIKGIKNI